MDEKKKKEKEAQTSNVKEWKKDSLCMVEYAKNYKTGKADTFYAMGREMRIKERDEVGGWKERLNTRIRDAERKREPREAKQQSRETPQIERERGREIRCIESENKRESWIKSEFSSERERSCKKGGERDPE